MPRRVASLFMVLAPLLCACATVPGTGRSQLRLMPLGQEMSLGAQAYEEALQDTRRIGAGPQYDMVQRVGRRVAEAAKDLYPDPALSFDWEIVLLDEPSVANAWALPGGKSAVYSGLLPITRDEDGLAIVVGHEVAHAIAHHGVERMSQEMIVDLGMTFAGRSLADVSPEKRELLMEALGIGVNVGALLPFSRSHESEADHLGLFLAAAAGYDPRAAIGLWERMASVHSGGRPPEFLSTHPSEETRIARLQELMPEAMEIYRARGGGKQPAP